jgi:DNA-binding winged helix-turn-helix (wHTH) protein/predicted ATPase
MRFVFGDCTLDTECYELRRAGQVVALEPRAFRVLAYLLRHAGRAVAKQELVQTCWPGTVETPYTEYALRNCLHKIRQAVGDAGRPRAVIETVRGYGYRWVTAVTTLQTDTLPAGDPPPQGQTDTRPAPVPNASPHALSGRRQLTVLRCAIVEDLALARLDPEDVQTVLQAFYRACEAVIVQYRGYIAQYDSAGLLVYFGYPTADEAAASRAVRAGLGLVEAVQRLERPGARPQSRGLTMRVGIHTGPVVVQESALPATPALAGATLTLATRVQTCAPPSTVVLSAATYHLVQGYFRCESLAEPLTTGDDDRLALYRVLGATGPHTRFEVAASRGLTPFVGREAELALLRERWAQIQDGRGHMIVLSGEPGIGKSRLVQVLTHQVARIPHVRWECRSSPYYHQTPLYPLTEFFHRFLHWQPDGSPAAKVATLEHMLGQYRLPLHDTMPLFASWLGVTLPAAHYPPLTLSPQRQRQQTLESLVAILLELAARQPVLFTLEDLHWADPTTLEWLALLLDHLPTAAIGAVVTCRPTFQPPWRPRSCLTQLTLHRLSRTESAAMLTQVVHGKALPPEVVAHVLAKTDGVPLFVEELLGMLLDTGLLQEDEDRYVLTGPLSASAIPATLQDLLRARLDQLPEAQDVVQLGATLGREFSYDVLQVVSALEAPALKQRLAPVIAAEILYQRGVPPRATYTFKHALIRDAAYQSLRKSTRQQYHQRIAQAVAERFPETAETQPELLAYHYTEAGLIAHAIPYWQRAGQRAIERSAYTEAIGHLRQGLEVLSALPDTRERAQHELPLQIALGLAFSVIRGHSAPEVGQTYARARALCQQVDEPRQLSATLAGLLRFYLVRGDLRAARRVGEQLLRLGQSQHCGLAFHHGAHGADLGVICRSWSAMVLWHLGYPEQSLQRNREALHLAQELSHPLSLSMGLNFAIIVHHFRRDIQVTLEQVEALETLTVEHVLQADNPGRAIRRGWALAEQGEVEEGLRHIRQGLACGQALEYEGTRTHSLALLAEACGKAGQTTEGLAALEAALALVHKNAERYFEAEIYRLRGELLRHAQGRPDETEACFQQALAVARRQQARALELRAAVSLARLWQQHGKCRDAYDVLAPIYDWFTEGFDTVDLQDARALLEELAG